MRTELYHALFTHFPIVLMGLSPVWLLLDAIGKPKHLEKTWTYAFRFFFYGGLLTYMVNLFLGDEAYEIVKNTACSLAALQKHDDLAHTALYIYLAGLLYEPSQIVVSKKVSGIFFFLILCAGSFYLFKTGHSGAEAVYELGTGVKTKLCP